MLNKERIISLSKKQLDDVLRPLIVFPIFTLFCNFLITFAGFQFSVEPLNLFAFNILIFYLLALIYFVSFIIRNNYYKVYKVWPLVLYLLLNIVFSLINAIVRNFFQENMQLYILIILNGVSIILVVLLYFIWIRPFNLLKKEAPNESSFPDFYSTYLVKPVSEYNEENASDLGKLFSSSLIATVFVTILGFIFSLPLINEMGVGLHTFIMNLTVLATVVILGIYTIIYNVKNKLIKTSIILGYFIFELVITLIYLGIIYIATMVDFGQDKFVIYVSLIPTFGFGFILYLFFIKKKIFNCHKYIEDYLKTTKVEDNNALEKNN